MRGYLSVGSGDNQASPTREQVPYLTSFSVASNRHNLFFEEVQPDDSGGIFCLAEVTFDGITNIFFQLVNVVPFGKDRHSQ